MERNGTYPSFWSLINDRMDRIVSQTVEGANSQLVYSKTLMSDFSSKVDKLLQKALQNVPYHPTKGSSQELHQTIHHDVEVAVDQAMQELHMEAADNSSFRDSLVKTLDTNIEMETFSKLLANSTNSEPAPDNSDIFQSMPVKDETMFISLVCLVVIVPIIFITLFAVFLYKRRKETKERSEEMLLKDQAVFSLEDSSPGDRQDEDVPDLDLNYRA